MTLSTSFAVGVPVTHLGERKWRYSESPTLEYSVTPKTNVVATSQGSVTTLLHSTASKRPTHTRVRIGTHMAPLPSTNTADSCVKCCQTHFHLVAELFTMRQEAKNQRVLSRFKKQLSMVGPPLIEDSGPLLAMEVGVEHIFEVTAIPCESSGIVLTTNMPPAVQTKDLESGEFTGTISGPLAPRGKIFCTKEEKFRLEAVSGQKALRMGELGHIPEVNPFTTHVRVLSMRRRACEGFALTSTSKSKVH